MLLCGAVIASDTAKDTKEEGNVPCFNDSLGYLLVINLFLLLEHALFIFYTHTDIWDLSAYGLIVYHAVSCCMIVYIWQTQCKENTVPSDAVGDGRSESKGVPNPVWMIPGPFLSPFFKVYHLIKSEPLQGTIYLVRIMVVLGLITILERLLPPTEYRNILIVVYRLFTSVTFLVANYYIWKFLTSPAAYAIVPVKGRHWSMAMVCSCGFLLVILLLGVAEIICAMIYQMAYQLILDGFLLTVGIMNVSLVLHEGT